MYLSNPKPLLVMLLAAGLGTGSAAHAAVRLPALVGNHMVVQRDVPVPVWGWAAPGEQVAVTFRGRSYQATPNAAGRWQVALPATPAGGPYTITIKGQNTLTVDDVLVGDVWLASGQSNMELPLRDKNAPAPGAYPLILNAEQEVAMADFPQIRQFTVQKVVAYQPQTENEGYNWQVCSPATAGSFSAVAYFFARDLYQRYHVPIGIISSPWGGTPAEAWVSAEALQQLPDFQAPLAALAQRPARPATLEKDAQNTPTVLYNGMIAPLQPYALKGVIWYQGESNTGRGAQYRTLFPALIRDWRARWGSELPFLFVQLANFTKTLPLPGPSDWAEVREAQAQALALPRTGMAVAIDLGDPDDIHPANKQDVGHRLALVARQVAYGDKKVVAAGPTFQRLRVDGKQVRLTFTNTGSGLLLKSGTTTLSGFAVAGADGQFHWATATLAGPKEVVLTCAAVPSPVAVRYSWANNPLGNLYNREGLPAVPFRTDAPAGAASKP
ncbi:sialate O-acetylesterase [Hymenobacter mucosus]|uniref:Sialate O-acetylesterase n=1 Tax=Hymenobacter mucosus TaxID=1411120 RepID=A0A239AP55_9BACT|nr:sialate O-acetylesterase [Hymenobacter mucosus]SNR97486.1 sialate O-acetylesterase [Hymenobacter mucosus]